LPQLTVRGIEPSSMAVISKPLVADMAAIFECDTNKFTIDCLPVTSVYGGEAVPVYPFIEVAWFERGTAVRDRLALALTRHVQSLGVPELEIAFRVYTEEAYYINGLPCS